MISDVLTGMRFKEPVKARSSAVASVSDRDSHHISTRMREQYRSGSNLTYGKVTVLGWEVCCIL